MEGKKHTRIKKIGRSVLKSLGFKRTEIHTEFRIELPRRKLTFFDKKGKMAGIEYSKRFLKIDIAGKRNEYLVGVECGEHNGDAPRIRKLQRACDILILIPYSKNAGEVEA